jgi:carboxyl-terminal processing protease
MRAGAIVLAWLLAASVLAAPVPLSRPAPPPDKTLTDEQAQLFANNLAQLIFQVSESYVRPITQADLTFAALSGLYETARKPVPKDLRKRITDAIGKEEPKEVAVARGVFPAGLAPLLATAVKEAGAGGNLEGQNLLLLACQSMTHVLDPHTLVITATEAREAAGLNQTYEGFGMEADLSTNRVTIRTVQPGGPAQQAGLRPGDELLRIDGKTPAEWEPEPLRARLVQVPSEEMTGAPPAPKLVLSVRGRRGKPEREVTLTRERFRPETILGVRRHDDHSWDYWADRKNRIAHVRVGPLANGTANELRGVLENLQADGVRGLVLDLRWCPGGFLKEASGVAELLLGPCEVATIKTRNDKEVFRSTGEGKFLDFPVIALISPSTSGGGELVACALQDHHRARIAGQRSRGKGSVQNSFFAGDVGLKLTTGTFYRPNGKSLHRFADSRPQDDWGVRPEADLEMRLSPDLGKQLERWWLWQTLRPGGSTEALPLDDPEMDPQRQAAVAAMREMIERKAPAKARPPAGGS